MTLRLAIPLALFALACAGPALAAGGTPTTPAEPATSDTEVVCKVQKITGSRLGAKRVCLTQAQWRQQRQDHREESERAQRTRYSNYQDLTIVE